MSVIIASFNSAAFVGEAIRSALRQSLRDIEVIVVDDASTDTTMSVLAAESADDLRVQIHRLTANAGPGAARNRAIEMARGEWLAILDADDLMAPDRLRQLVELGERHGADVVADDLVVFGESSPTTLFLGIAERGGWLSVEDYLRRTVIYGGDANLGYLKPLIRLDRLQAAGVRYDTALRIAEDDDFVVRMLAAGMRYWLDPAPRYAYRRHPASTSHRLSVANATTMLGAGERLAVVFQGGQPGVRQALARRNRGLQKALAFARLIEALKGRQLLEFAKVGWSNPAALGLLHLPVTAAFNRLTRRRLVEKDDSVAVSALAEIMQ